MSESIIPGGWEKSSINNHYCKFSSNRDSKSTSKTVFSKNTSKYNNFISKAEVSANITNNGKQEPITVRLENSVGNKSSYQFPYEYSNNWEGFKQSLGDAFPEYKDMIKHKEIILIDKDKKIAFIPLHFGSFIYPGQSLIIRLNFIQCNNRRQALKLRKLQLARENAIKLQELHDEIKSNYSSGGSEASFESNPTLISSFEDFNADIKDKLNNSKFFSFEKGKAKIFTKKKDANRFANWLYE